MTQSIDLGFNNILEDVCDYRDYSNVTARTKVNGLTVLQHNIRGVLGKQDQLKLLLNSIGNECQVHCVLLAETWLKKHTENRVKIPGYSFVGSHRKYKRGGGVGILISQKLNYRHRKDLSLNKPNFESLTIEVKTYDKNIFLCSVYRPPNSNEKDFLKNYTKLLNRFTPHQQDRLIIGLDHNLDLIKYIKHKATSEFIEINLEHQLLPTITKPTRITRITATLLDNIIIGRTFQANYEPSIVISDLSDHLPCLLQLCDNSIFTKPSKKIITRGLNQDKVVEVNNILQKKNWEKELGANTVSEQYTIFHHILQDTLDKVAPFHSVKIPTHKLIREPWMSKGLYKCHKKQQQLYKITLKQSSTDVEQQRYKTYRNKLKQIQRKAKEDYYKAKCIEYRNNTSRLWKMINKMTNKTNDKTDIIECLKVGNQDYYEHKLIAEEFAKHFSSVGKKFAEQIGSPSKDINHYLAYIPNNPKSIFMQPVTIQEIENLINNLPNKKSSGYDNLSNVLLKQIKPSIINPLTLICNNSIKEGEFPHDMKAADVSPLHKSKERHVVTNYRPISLLITLSKILEKVVYSRVYNFLVETDQLYQSQYGFRSGHSCQNAISELVGTILKNQEENKITIGVFIDLSKAFDTLSHDILLNKLGKYGIRGTTLKWFESYLSNRSMRVKIQNNIGEMEYSTYHPLTYGTPQGSCLGPLLFLIFINDLHYSVTYGTSLLFADDTTIIHSHKNLRYLKWTVETDLNNLMDWFKANKLTLNLDKTVCMLFDSKAKAIKLNLNIGDYILQTSETVKFLGVWIDEKLAWTKHTSLLIMKLKQNMHLLRINNKFLTKDTKKLIYYAHIFSHLNYGILVWGNMIRSDTFTKLQKIMNKCFKLITGKEATPKNFKDERMLRLKDLIELENKKLGYQLDNHLLPSNLYNLLWTDSKNKSLQKTHHYNTREKHLPNLPKVSTTYQKGFQYQSIKDYEATPMTIRQSSTLDSFVKRLKRHFLTMP